MSGRRGSEAAHDELQRLQERVRELESRLADKEPIPDRCDLSASAAAELQDNERRMRLLLQQLPAVVWTTDTELRFTSSAGAGLARLGLRQGEVVGRTVREFRDDPGADATLHAHLGALAGNSVTYEDAFRDGTYRSRVEPLRDARGTIIGVLGVAYDITEERRARERMRQLNAELEARVAERTAELRRSEALFRAVSEQMPDGLMLIDIEPSPRYGQILATNESAARMVGCSVDELVGASIFDLEDEPTLAGSAERVERLRRGETLVFEGRLRRHSGVTAPIEAKARLVEWGCKPAVLAVLRDLTQRKEAEKQLRLVQSAVTQVTDAVTITDATVDLPGPQIIYVNPAFERMTGYAAHEVLGRTPRILQGPRTHRAVLDRLRRHLQEGRPFYGETFNYRKDGSEFLLEWRIAPIRDETGTITNFVAIQRDLTDQRRAEAMVEQHRAELAHVARLSTMGEMASGLAHELNQPLAAIANYVRGCLRRMELETISKDELRDAMERVATQAQRAGQVIQRLRRFVRKREPRRSTSDLNHLAEEAAALMESEIRDAAVDLTFVLDPVLPLVLIDAIQIEQVVLNLLRNAVEAVAGNPPGARRVTLATRQPAPGTVELKVSDTGPGLSDEDLQRVFAPFFTTKPHGMGMGLTISRTIAEAHGGRLDASRDPEGGTVFVLTLPTPRRRLKPL